MSKWTEGVCDDGAAILRDGEMVPINKLLSHLNDLEATLRDIEVRTRAYADDFDGWPLIAGIHKLAISKIAKEGSSS